MKQRTKQFSVVGEVILAGALVFAGVAHAQEEWSAPAPAGPFGGDFDFGLPEANSEALQAEYAMYRKQGELPVMNASYEPAQPTVATVEGYSEAELSLIDPAWELERPVESSALVIDQEGIWALGEIQAEKVPALVGEQQAAVVEQQLSKLEPCRVEPQEEKQPFSSAHTPFQEAMLDEFEHGDLDMEQVAREADEFSSVEEDRSWSTAPVYYRNFIPDYALGVRRADAMDPLALIPQTRKPVQYFGFTQQ